MLTRITIGLTGVLGALAFAAPFFAASLAQTDGATAGMAGAPLLLSGAVLLSVLTLLFETQRAIGNSVAVALLGVLVAINSVLRFAEVAIPGPGGFTPIFALIILSGYVFGGAFGSAMGALTLLVSALLTGGVGPWLPYQMFAASWVGLSAPLCRRPIAALGLEGRAGEALALALFGAVWGLLFGAIMNLWSWPYIAGDPAQSWQSGLGAADALRRYAAYYVVTSLWWDSFGAAGNALLIAALGAPVLRILRRFQRRLVQVQVLP